MDPTGVPALPEMSGILIEERAASKMGIATWRTVEKNHDNHH